VKLIASYCNVTESTIKKYIRGSDLNPDWLRRGEKTGAGRHGFTVIHNLDVSDEIKSYIADRYIDREIKKNTVDVLKKATNEKLFMEIPEDNVKECIDQIIEKHSKDYETIKEIVVKNSLKAGYLKSSHTYMFNFVLKSLMRIEEVFKNSYFVNHLSDRKKEQLVKSIRNLLSALNPLIKWSDFPTRNRNQKRMVTVRNKEN